MGIKVIEKGLLTSIQDRGRFGYAQLGVPKSGAMDRYSAKIANLLVGNEGFKAVMEITLLGPLLEFTKDAFIVLVGIEANIRLNGNEISLLKPFKVKKGDRLHIKQITKGARLYLAIFGGFQTEVRLESRSQFYPVTKASSIQKGELIPISENEGLKLVDFASVKYKNKELTSSNIEVFKGPEWDQVPSVLQEQILSTELTISKNNSRMAYQLQEQFPNTLEGMLSQPVLPGTVQFTPDGNLIILMRDAQTTGGYSRIFQLTEDSINVLAQKRQGDSLQLKLIDED
ncbi:biotin-dependent carboxyltransferase family protein [Mesonia sp. K4-1]|uniref:5-oxoprolinase subunit C family protein n=1 Tax=Mesonia sp. K4-1 TaxID=2602760 RepID=UPI0011C9A5A4|nr:biotin-dependent carboxyltransferase family protein [Mesonia sp. K4-1]TXK74925.1 biotin-dependent carboxyltransferase family protein [Mesonia sp. K4-1]